MNTRGVAIFHHAWRKQPLWQGDFTRYPKEEEEGAAWKYGNKAMLGRRNRESKDKYCVISLRDSEKYDKLVNITKKKKTQIQKRN